MLTGFQLSFQARDLNLLSGTPMSRKSLIVVHVALQRAFCIFPTLVLLRQFSSFPCSFIPRQVRNESVTLKHLQIIAYKCSNYLLHA